MILQALTQYYERLIERGVEDVPTYGFSQQKISFAILLDSDGSLVNVRNIQDTSGKKPKPALLLVPAPPARSVNIDPCFLWDKTSYVLGLTGSESEKDQQRALKTFEAFRDTHVKSLGAETDEGLCALRMFLENWKPEGFVNNEKFKKEDFLDSNIVFRLESEQRYIHERPAAKSLLNRILQEKSSDSKLCLVSGEHRPLARLHPTIKGVNGAQSSGAALVSFNLDSFTSYGKKQGENAPVSELVAFSYTAALNYLLRRDERNRQRLQIGDTSVVLWAIADSVSAGVSAEAMMARFLAPRVDDDTESEKLHVALNWVSQGKPLKELNPDLDPNTKIFVLGLAPNASRLSIRFWETNTLQKFAERLALHYQDLFLKPTPWKNEPPIWRLLLETVPHRQGSKPKLDDVQPQLAGDIARAILTGNRYPRSLLNNIVMRLRADGDVSSLRVALLKAVLTRDKRLGVKGIKQEVPVALDKSITDPGYLLGRLFSELEFAQEKALGTVNSPLRDRFYGAASATPASVFPSLIRNSNNHIAKLRKGESSGLVKSIEISIGEIFEKLGGELPKSLRIEAQGQFAIGYYHQRNKRFTKKQTSEEGDKL